MPYIGKSPSSGIRNRFIYTATAGQTTFSGTDDHNRTLSYTDAEFTDVFLNGVKLDKSDYTATSGTSIVLDSGASAGDTLEILAFDTFGLFSGEFAQDVSVGGDLTVDTDTLKVDSTNNRVGIGNTSPAQALSIGSATQVATTTPSSISLGGSYNSGSGGEANRTKLRLWEGDTSGSNVMGLGVSTNQIDYVVDNAAFTHQFYVDGSKIVKVNQHGLLFGTDTAAVNALDDYEEGTWIPTYTATTSNPTISYSIQVGRYTKIGDYVTLWTRLKTASYSGGSGALLISGLPFTSNDTGNFYGVVAVGFTATTWGTSPTAGLINPDATTINLRKRSSTSAHSAISPQLDADASGGDVYTAGAGNDIILSAFYKV